MASLPHSQATFGMFWLTFALAKVNMLAINMTQTILTTLKSEQKLYANDIENLSFNIMKLRDDEELDLDIDIRFTYSSSS